ncbi:putative tRNA N6-adenosine threonylcarbamoyltransferase, mitochondrial [Halotydeus destructor]|nr:putative tRNA N6-adenosine threonylcarbamoyltransferase, mitochondrial [Halotydeus destructor]
MLSFSLLKVQQLSSKLCSRRFSMPTAEGARLVLGIETSCDDTAAAIVDQNGNILSDCCESQLKVHQKHGGVVPTIAKDLHNKNINNVVIETLRNANKSIRDIDVVAVTNRPGLPMSLGVGVHYAKQLAIQFGKPLAAIHHMEAHATIGTLCNPSITYPFLSLLISGGHAQLVIVKSIHEFLLLGETADDAPGEVFDKMARRFKLKNLGPPFDQISGGAAIEKLAKFGNPLAYFSGSSTAIPLSRTRDCNFSFSGLKTFGRVCDSLESQHADLPPDQPLPEVADLAASLQHMITVHILKRLHRALRFLELSDYLKTEEVDEYGSRPMKPTLDIVVSGGVACNDYIAEAIKGFLKSVQSEFDFEINLTVPRPYKLCSDNGIMIAWNAVLQLRDDKISLLRDKDDIQKLDFVSRSPLGTNISHEVAKMNIAPGKIKHFAS